MCTFFFVYVVYRILDILFIKSVYLIPGVPCNWCTFIWCTFIWCTLYLVYLYLMYLVPGVLCTWYTLYLVYLVPVVPCTWCTFIWCTLYLVYFVPGVPYTCCTLYLVYLQHLMTWFLCTEGLKGLGDVRHDLVQHPEYLFLQSSCFLIRRKYLYLLHKTMQRWMYWRSRTPMARLAARMTAISIRSRCTVWEFANFEEEIQILRMELSKGQEIIVCKHSLQSQKF